MYTFQSTLSRMIFLFSLPTANSQLIVIESARDPTESLFLSISLGTLVRMDAVERENTERQKRWWDIYPCYNTAYLYFNRVKDQKVGEGTYAVVYRGAPILRWTFPNLKCRFRKGISDRSQSRYQKDKGGTLQGWTRHVCHPRSQVSEGAQAPECYRSPSLIFLFPSLTDLCPSSFWTSFPRKQILTLSSNSSNLTWR